MSRWLAGLVVLLLAALPGAASAQTRTVVVPAGPAVVIAPRGQPAPRATLGAPSRRQARFVPPPAQQDDLAAPSAAAVIALAGAAGVAAMIAGGGGGGGSVASPSATVRTR